MSANPSRLHGEYEKFRGEMKDIAGHLTRNHAKTDEGRAMKAAGSAEVHESKANHAIFKQSERHEEVKAARDWGKAEYYHSRAEEESLRTGKRM
ncbi:hypothetical protein HK104_008088 [Borealophlyctis nickersoniae]|nr:hypothetical protein HK104_008088 [Borealophlyctis nickersoniae]